MSKMIDEVFDQFKLCVTTINTDEMYEKYHLLHL